MQNAKYLFLIAVIGAGKPDKSWLMRENEREGLSFYREMLLYWMCYIFLWWRRSCATYCTATITPRPSHTDPCLLPSPITLNLQHCHIYIHSEMVNHYGAL